MTYLFKAKHNAQLQRKLIQIFKKNTKMPYLKNTKNTHKIRKTEKLENKHNAELQRADPGTKGLGVVFSHTMPKMDFRYSHHFS